MRPSVELNYLKYFYFTVVEGGVSPAAGRLCVQQPVVSKMVGALEAQLGKPLFKKEGRRNLLTDFGQLVFRHCQVIFEEIDNLGRLEKAEKNFSGTLNIGAAEPIAGYVLPKALSPLMAKHPAVNFNVYTATATQLLEMIADGNLDLGLFFHMPGPPKNVEVLAKLPVRFLVVIKFEKRHDPAVIQSFIGSREIDDRSNQKFPTVELLRTSYPKTRITFSSNHLGLHRALVREGRGVSILPEFMVKEDVRRKVLSDLYPRQKFIFDLKVIARRGVARSPLVDPLLTFLADI